MDWSKHRATLIGAGAVVVAGVALGVAVANGGTSHHQRPFAKVAGAYFEQRFGPLPFRGGPMRERLQVLPPMPGHGGPQLRRFGVGPSFAGPLAGRLLHGEGTLAGPNGTYETVDVQRGTVTKVSKGSVTVRSADGFTKTYAATASLLRAVANGDLVQLRATVSGNKATVVALTDLNRMTRSSTGGPPPPQ